jgi:hypothetical protein
VDHFKERINVSLRWAFVMGIILAGSSGTVSSVVLISQDESPAWLSALGTGLWRLALVSLLLGTVGLLTSRPAQTTAEAVVHPKKCARCDTEVRGLVCLTCKIQPA